MPKSSKFIVLSLIILITFGDTIQVRHYAIFSSLLLFSPS
jgi:hypothetical protein